MTASQEHASANETTGTFQDNRNAPVKYKKLWLLVFNYIPLIHLALVLLTAFLGFSNLTTSLLAALVMLYLLPPATARILLFVFPITKQRIRLDEREFYVWWALLNLQVIYCRLPFLEEILRCIPSLYSAWLRLWGAKIGRLTYWAAGTVILDRHFLSIGDDVIFGAGVRLNPHVLAKDAEGSLELLLERITIGDRVVVGGYSLLTAGTTVAADECTKAFLLSPPFSKWKNGKREKQSEQRQPQ